MLKICLCSFVVVVLPRKVLETIIHNLPYHLNKVLYKPNACIKVLVVVLLLSLTENVAKNCIELKIIMRELLDKLANLLFVISLVTLVGSLIFVDTE